MPRNRQRRPPKKKAPYSRRGVCHVCHEYGEVVTCPNPGCSVAWCKRNLFHTGCGQWAWDTYHQLSCDKPVIALHRMLVMLQQYEPDIYDQIKSHVPESHLAATEPTTHHLIQRLGASPVAVPRRLREAAEEIRSRDVERAHWEWQRTLGAPKIKEQRLPNRLAVTDKMLSWTKEILELPNPENPKTPFWGKTWDKSIYAEFDRWDGRSY